MFAALIEKLTRHEDLTTDEAAAAMAEIMERRAAPAQIAGLLDRPGDEGRAAGRDRRPRADDARAGRAVVADARHVFDTCGTGGDRAGTFNISTGAALVVAACGVRVAKHGNRSVSSRCGSADVFEALGVQHRRRRRRSSSAAWRRRASAFFFAPTFHPSMRHAGADAAGARRAHRVQSARAADESGRRHAAARRRAAARAHRADGASAGAARLGARVGRPRRGRPRRDLDDRLHEGLGVPRRRGATPSTCIRPMSACRRRRRGRWRAATPRDNARDRPATCSAASRRAARRRAAERRRRAVHRRARPRRSTRALLAAARAIDRRRARRATLDRAGRRSRSTGRRRHA